MEMLRKWVKTSYFFSGAPNGAKKGLKPLFIENKAARRAAKKTEGVTGVAEGVTGVFGDFEGVTGVGGDGGLREAAATLIQGSTNHTHFASVSVR